MKRLDSLISITWLFVRLYFQVVFKTRAVEFPLWNLSLTSFQNDVQRRVFNAKIKNLQDNIRYDE